MKSWRFSVGANPTRSIGRPAGTNQGDAEVTNALKYSGVLVAEGQRTAPSAPLDRQIIFHGEWCLPAVTARS